MNNNKIKNIFLNYFKKKKHKIFKSLSIINKNKKYSNLMFINSGINQFLEYFLNKKKPKYLKIANIQKCIRITGKNNDLNIVGYDNYHHTMFEMLGNWSFGEYSQKTAIKMAWELITKKYKISKNNIYVTIFKGDKKNKLNFDKQSYNIWKKLINKKNILFFGFKHNFWKIDNFNLCGPSSEIHIDIRKINKNKLGRDLVNKNNNYVIELWNIVNIKYIIKNNKIFKNKSLLSNNYIDTGMGLERLCMILQNKKSTYETDLFSPIIKIIENILCIKYGKNKKIDIVIKIISDHIRTIYFSMLDGVIPNNKKEGYIIRKLIRRSLIYSYKYLNIKKPFLFKIIPIFDKNKKQIIKLLKQEELNYFFILKKNIFIVKNFIKDKIINSNFKLIDNKLILFFYETYGLYYFIIKKIAKKYNLKIVKTKLIEI
ncbi:alanine--tRNA ligase-related protein [Candidatus Shikimatogenerans bostrichidophilus]|uniref:alanine--tRNA ligase-related protein n=1 Tax=Candidatus Shikimatogenerans bostrichidophilus TaxID=2943807 RepID=UPI00296715E9